MTNKQLAEAFSNGKFEITFPYISDDMIWNVVGESVTQGKEAVVRKCTEIAEYFDSVTTEFRTTKVAEGSNFVAVCGTAEFLSDGTRLAYLDACDLYEFSDKGMLVSITSYCINTGHEKS